MKNLLILIVFLSLVQTGCGQQTPASNKASSAVKAPITESNQEKITAKNYIQKEIKTVNVDSQGFEYYFSITPKECFYEILVNDIPVYRHFEDGGVADPVCLNPYINHSGKQSFTYRLYPQTTGTNEDGLKKLTAQTRLKIKLYGRKESDRINAYKNKKLLFDHTSATTADGQTFIAAGKDFYEYTITFDAEVPYKLVGTDDSQDLSKLDQKSLLTKTETAYQYYWKLIKDKNMDDYFRLGFKSDVSEILSSYVSKEDLEAVEDADKFHFLIPEFKLEPMKGYRMRLYGNGKIVCLEQTSEDPKLKNRSPVWGEGQLSSGEISSKFYKLYLHMPKGKDTFEILYKTPRFSDIF